MKKIYLLSLFFIAYLSSYAEDTNLARIIILSQEINTVNGQLTVKARIKANEKIYFYNENAILPSGWQFNGITYPSTGNSVAKGDSVEVIASITYPTQKIPFYPVSIQLTFDIQKAGTSTPVAFIAPSEKETITTQGKIYFTPYNTVEVWEEGDFMDLKRTWVEKGSLTDTTRIYIPKSAIPQTDITNETDTLKEDWQDDYQLKFVSGLAYAVQMKAIHPDVVAAQNEDDGADSTYTDGSNPQARFGRRTFTGTITGRLVSTIVNDLGIRVTIPLSGVLVKLKEDDKGFNEEFEQVTTDANGNFTIRYSVSQSYFEGKHIEPFLKIKSKNKEYDIKVKKHAILGGTYDIVRKLGSHGTNATIALNNIMIDSEPWRLLHWTVQAWRYVESQNISLFDGLSILAFRKNSNMLGDGAFGISFPLTNPTIRIESGDGNHESTIRHEFGHFIMWCIQNRNYISVYADPNQDGHFWGRENTSRMAWSEGWADAIEMILDAVFWNEDQEYGREELNRRYEERRDFDDINRGIWSEYYIACALYDLWDGPGKGVPATVGGSYVGFDDMSAARVPMGGWSEAENVELSFYQIARPIILNSGSSGKITHIGEYFNSLINSVVGQNNCASVSEVSNLFVQNRVIYNIDAYNDRNGDNTGFSTDLVSVSTTESIYGKLLGVGHTYTDTYTLNPYTNRATTFDYFLPAPGNAVLTDDILLSGTTRSVNTLRFNPANNGSASGTFYTCGNIEISTEYTNVILGGTTTSSRLDIRAGSVYRMRQGSVLTINNNSTLAINCGARLIFEAGASIVLNGPNARIIINGTLEVGAGATFNYPTSSEIPVISGSSQISLTGSTYSINMTAASYTWTVPSGWKINGQTVSSLTINGSSGTMVTIQPPACGISGTISVRANGCANSTAQYAVTAASCATTEALSFDGVNDYVNIPHLNSRLNLGTGSFVMEAFIKSNASGSVRALLSKRSTVNVSTADGFLFGTWSDGRPFIQLKGAPNILPPSGSANLYDGNCHQVAVRRSGTTISFFVDGKFIGNGNLTSNRDISNTKSLRIAADPVTTSAYNGWIGEVRVWNTALSDAQIAANVSKTISAGTVGLTALYDMKEAATSQTVTDLSTTVLTTRNNGTLGSSSASDASDAIWLTSSQLSCTVQGNFRKAAPAVDNSFIADSTQMKSSRMAAEEEYTAETIQEGITIYPNPSSNEFLVNVVSQYESYNLQVANVMGTILYTARNLHSSETYSIGSQLQPGVYLFIVDEGRKKRVIKVIKK